MTNGRVIVVGGALSFRALFAFLTPWIYVPVLLVYPVLQIVFFAYVGRAAHLEADSFYVVGGAVLATALPCLFAMSQTLVGERRSQTLSLLLASPASRWAIYVGRALPTIINGFLVAVFALTLGALLLGVDVAAGSLPLLAICILAGACSTTGLGLVCGAFGLRGHQTTVLANVLALLLLVFSGATVPLGSLPDWMQTVAQGLPLTHAIEAARQAAAGASIQAAGGLLLEEAAISVLYAGIGLLLLRASETDARRRGTLDFL